MQPDVISPMVLGHPEVQPTGRYQHLPSIEAITVAGLLNIHREQCVQPLGKGSCKASRHMLGYDNSIYIGRHGPQQSFYGTSAARRGADGNDLIRVCHACRRNTLPLFAKQAIGFDPGPGCRSYLSDNLVLQLPKTGSDVLSRFGNKINSPNIQGFQGTHAIIPGIRTDHDYRNGTKTHQVF